MRSPLLHLTNLNKPLNNGFILLDGLFAISLLSIMILIMMSSLKASFNTVSTYKEIKHRLCEIQHEYHLPNTRVTPLVISTHSISYSIHTYPVDDHSVIEWLEAP